MPSPLPPTPTPTRPARAVLATLVVGALVGLATLPVGPAHGSSGIDHMLVSEVVTGGGSASDEFIELYNPSESALPLEGLELVYVSASGLTVSRRAAWELGAPVVPPRRHVLVANESGIYASIADATYSSAIAATGGSVALRIVGASSAIDAVGWGTAASAWMEGTPTAAPAAGASIERLPGGPEGSTRDTDDNLADFVVRAVPEPQNSGSAPTPEPAGSASPGASPPPTDDPGSSASPSGSPPTPVPTATPVPAPPTAGPTPVASDPGPTIASVAEARAQPDGSVVSIEVTALTGSAFTDGGGYVADGTGGIAALPTGVAFDRGERLRLTGIVGDRYSQRTLRLDAAGLVRLGSGADATAASSSTGAIGESVEGRLVRIRGAIVGARSALTTGTALDVDDGSGPVRVLVGTATGIDLDPWTPGRTVTVVGIAGQRDSTGSGVSGYRVQPRDPGDIVVAPPVSPTPDPSASPTPGGGDGPITIAAAREVAANGAVRVRGVVTLPAGIVDPATVAIQDATAAIVLRVGSDVGPLARGALVEISGMRSTLAGMETIRVSAPPHASSSASEPGAAAVGSGRAGEAHEAQLVVVRGALVGAARRYASGTVSFEIDDGSGPLRVSFSAATAISADDLAAGTWIEVRGVLGQETSGSEPLAGYRLWPRDADDLRVVAPATGDGDGPAAPTDPSGPDAPPPPLATLADLGSPGSGGAVVGATLVVGPWPELGLAGLLWDGSRLVALDAVNAAQTRSLLRDHALPLAVQLDGLARTGSHGALRIPVARVPAEPEAILPVATAVSPPRAAVPQRGDAPAWTSLVGVVERERGGHRSSRRAMLAVDGGSVRLDRRCAAESAWGRGPVGITGIGLATPPRLVVPCGMVVPAPTLDLGSAPTSTSLPPARLVGVAPDGGEPDGLPSRLPAAGLVSLAAALLAAGSVTARRLGDDPPTPPDLEEGETPPDEAATSVAPPSLTLVPLPRERAP